MNLKTDSLLTVTVLLITVTLCAQDQPASPATKTFQVVPDPPQDRKASSGWDAVQRISPDHKIEVLTLGERMRGTFVSANENALVIRLKSGERSIARNDTRQVRVADPSRRIRNGLIGTAIGAAAGLGLGIAVCPHCGNEGAGGTFTVPFTAAGAGGGAAAGFLLAPYRRVYKSN